MRADYAAAQAKVAQIRAMRISGFDAIEAVPEVLASATIINLRERETQLLKEESDLRSTYGAKHPRIVSIQQEKGTLQRKIQAEVSRILKTIENDAEVTASRIEALEREIAAVSGGTSIDREVAVKLRELERDADASRNIYNSFLERYKETAEQQQLIEADAKVVSTAAPPTKPSTPGPKLFGAVGFTASLMLGTLLALLMERFDSGLRSARQVEQTLGLPALWGSCRGSSGCAAIRSRTSTCWPSRSRPTPNRSARSTPRCSSPTSTTRRRWCWSPRPCRRKARPPWP